MDTIFTVVKYEEKVEGNTVKLTLFENKSFTAKKIFDVANKNDFQVIVITRDIILVKAVSPFYADGRKKYRYWTFFTAEEWRELKAEEAEA